MDKLTGAIVDARVNEREIYSEFEANEWMARRAAAAARPQSMAQRYVKPSLWRRILQTVDQWFLDAWPL